MNAPRQTQLLESANHLDWLPDETLFSLASRHHRLSGNLRPDKTAMQLFGHRRGGSPHDLPAGLDYFSAALAGRLGTGKAVAMERTVLAGLLAFRDESDRRDAIQTMCSPRLGALKSRLGLPASGFGATCVLKACVSCMRADAAHHGTAYWRRAHQIPGASLCLEHQQVLRISLSDRAKQSRFNWRLPELSDLAEVFDRRTVPSEKQLSLMRRTTQMVTDAAATVTAPAKDAGRLSSALWTNMAVQGWITRSGRLNRKIAVAQWLELMLELRVLPEWSDIRITEGSAYSQILSLLGDPTRGHILRPLTLVACLFQSWKDYEACVDSLPQRVRREETVKLGEDPSAVRNQFFGLVDSEGSISAAARALGIAVVTAQAWVVASGNSPPKRPSKLRDETLSKVLDDLRRGLDPPQIAVLVGVSEASVRRILRTTVGLRGQWNNARRMTSQQWAREQWSRTIKISATAGLKAARALEPRAYAWLYRNDRAWLLATNEAVKCPSAGNHANVDWDARDRTLSDACLRAALELRERASGGRINLVDIIRFVPELRTKLYRLENLPLTARVIRRLVSATRTTEFVR